MSPTSITPALLTGLAACALAANGVLPFLRTTVHHDELIAQLERLVRSGHVARAVMFAHAMRLEVDPFASGALPVIKCLVRPPPALEDAQPDPVDEGYRSVEAPRPLGEDPFAVARTQMFAAFDEGAAPALATLDGHGVRLLAAIAIALVSFGLRPARVDVPAVALLHLALVGIALLGTIYGNVRWARVRKQLPPFRQNLVDRFVGPWVRGLGKGDAPAP